MGDGWLREKTCNLIWALAEIAEYVNALPNYREQDDQGHPTWESFLANHLFMAVDKATTMLAYEVAVDWNPLDREWILRDGRAGYLPLLARYGLADSPDSHPPLDFDFYRPLPLGSLKVLEDTWIFDTFDVQRPLHDPVTWDGIVVAEAQQRASLVHARELTHDYAQKPKGWLLLTGRFGAGKSHLAGAIIQEVVKQGMAPLYQSALDIAYRYRSSGDREWLAEQSRLGAADLLVLDNLDYDDRIVWNRYLERLLRGRYWTHRPTVLVSVSSRDSLPGWITDSVTEVPLIASDYRRLRKRPQYRSIPQSASTTMHTE